MLKLIVSGNLGANAELHNENGKQFVSMSIAHTRRFRDGSGNEKEETQWISATLNGDGGKLLPYLVKGARVHCIGDPEVRMFHSEKQRALVAGLKIFIRDIELLGGNPEPVPRDLYDKNGAAHQVLKYYNVPNVPAGELYSRQGEIYAVDANGWVTPPTRQDPSASAAVASEVSQEGAASPSETQPETASKMAGSKKSAKGSENEGYQGF